MEYIFALGVLILLVFFLLIIVASRYKRCPPDKVLVIYGKVGKASSSKCLHGGGAFVWPIIQNFQFLDLTPIPIDIILEGALSQQNIRINTPSTFTVGVSVETGVMENAAERLLGLNLQQVRELAKDIIFGQMRVAIATMPIEEINADRDKLIDNISNGVEVELKKVGLRLINVNIQDITDESGYIDALGREAAARAINEAKVRVAEKERDGEIGKSNAQREQRIKVSEANASAVEGENTAAVTVARSQAKRREAEAEANRSAEAAEKVKSAQALSEAYEAESKAEDERAKREKSTQYANVIIPAEIEKSQIETLAEAAAERVRREKKGQADGIRFLKSAEAAGIQAVKEAEASGVKADLVARAEAMKVKAEGIQAELDAKAEGIRNLYKAAAENTEFAAQMILFEQLPQIISEQVKAISNLKIDKVTVWDSGANGTGKSSTSNFLSSLAGSLPPIHEIFKNAGVSLPSYLGKIDGAADDNKLAKTESSNATSPQNSTKSTANKSAKVNRQK